jgi:hypothetical protein
MEGPWLHLLVWKPKPNNVLAPFKWTLIKGIHGWLVAMKQIGCTYCFPCLLFSDEHTVWNQSGFCDLNNLTKACKRHSTECQAHYLQNWLFLLKYWNWKRVQKSTFEKKIACGAIYLIFPILYSFELLNPWDFMVRFASALVCVGTQFACKIRLCVLESHSCLSKSHCLKKLHSAWRYHTRAFRNPTRACRNHTRVCRNHTRKYHISTHMCQTHSRVCRKHTLPIEIVLKSHSSVL